MSTAYSAKRLLTSALVLVVLVQQSWCGPANKQKNMASGRNTIVQMFEWRWVDIASECENFLGPYGYGGVQVSPASENLIINDPTRPWYERYQPVSYEIATRSGDEAAFTDMVQRCNAANVRIYVDGVFNHMTGYGVGEGTGTGGSHYDASTETFDAVPYTSADFHTCADCPSASCGIENYNDPTQVRNCQLTGLLDLDQSEPHVQDRVSTYMNKLTGIGVAGFRLDAAKHMWPDDIAAIVDSLNDLPTSVFPAGSKPYIYQEVIDMRSEAVHYYEYTGIGDVTEFEYGYQLAYCFRNMNPMMYLSTWGVGWGLMPSDDALGFIDNHDTQRGSGPAGFDVLTFFDPRLYKMANAFMLAHPYGDIRVMSSYRWERNIVDGTDQNSWIGPPHDSDFNTLPVTFNPDLSCQGDWVCEHRWRQIYNMVHFRNVVDGTALENWWDNGGYQIAFSRGIKGFLVINNELETDLDQTLQTGMPAGTYCDVISGNLENGFCTGMTVTVGGDGTAHFSISYTWEDPMMAIHADAMPTKIENSGRAAQ